ncbi:hypothetical protein [Kitasatospora sp. NPDC101183]
MTEDQMAEYRDGTERTRTSTTTHTEVWAALFAGMFCLAVLAWLVVH